MTTAQRNILAKLTDGPADYLAVSDATFATLVELGVMAYAKWPIGDPFICITDEGIDALQPVEIRWPGMTAEEMRAA